jgi:hypothetical protein
MMRPWVNATCRRIWLLSSQPAWQSAGNELDADIVFAQVVFIHLPYLTRFDLLAQAGMTGFLWLLRHIAYVMKS